MNSAFLNETLNNVEVKRTRSGRVVIPPLAGWTGERIFTPLDDRAPVQYVTPTLDAKAQYLLSSSMLERLKKQKLIQEPLQVEEQNVPLSSSSVLSEKSVQQKNVGTGCKKSVTHKTKNVGLSKSQSKLICVELPPQKKRMKMTVHYQMIDDSDHVDTDHEMEKCQPLVHNDSDASDYHTRKGHFEVDPEAGGQCTTAVNHSKNQVYKKKKNNVHQDSFQQLAYQKIHIDVGPEMVNKAMLTDQNRNVTLPSNIKNSFTVVQHPRLSSSLHSSSCEADDENSNGSDTSSEISAKCAADSLIQKGPASQEHWNQNRAANVSLHNEISEPLDCSPITDIRNQGPDRRRETRGRNKSTDEHDKPILNVNVVEQNSEGISGGTNEMTYHIRRNKNVTEKTKTDLSKNQEHKKKSREFSSHNELHADDFDVCQNSSQVRRRRNDVSKKQADAVDGIFPKADSEVSVLAKNDSSVRHRGTGDLDQQAYSHSDDSCDLRERENYVDDGQIVSREPPLKKATPLPNKTVGCNSSGTDLSKGCMIDRPKEKYVTDGRKVQNVMRPTLKSTHSDKDKRTYYYALEHSVPIEVSALSEVRKRQNSHKGITVSSTENVNQKISPQKSAEIDKFAGTKRSNSSSVTKNRKDTQPGDFERNTLSSVKVKLRSISEFNGHHSSVAHDNLSQCSEQVVICDKSNDLVKTSISVLPDGRSSSNQLPQHNVYVSSEDAGFDNDCDHSRRDCSKNKLVCGSYVVSETTPKNLHKQLNSSHTYEEESVSETSDQSMSVVAKESCRYAGRNQNKQARKNNSREGPVKSSTLVTLNPTKKDFCKIAPISSRHGMCSPGKVLLHDVAREQNFGLSPPRSANKSCLSDENVTRGQNQVSDHRRKSSRKSLFNPVKSQLSDFVSTSFVYSSSSKKAVSSSKKRSWRKSSLSSDEDTVENEQDPTKNAEGAVRYPKRHKFELSAPKTDANVPSTIPSPRIDDSRSEYSQSSADAVKGSTENSTVRDNTSDSNQDLDNTFILSCGEEHEDFSNHGDVNQISNESLIKQNVRKDSSHAENSTRNKQKISSYPQKYVALETDLVDCNSQRPVKEHHHKHNHKQKSENPKKDSSSVPRSASCNSDLSDHSRNISYACNFNDRHSRKKRDLSKHISLHCSSVESESHNTPAPCVAKKVPPRSSETNSFSCRRKIRPEKSKDFQSDLVINNDVTNGFVDLFHNNSGLHDVISSELSSENAACDSRGNLSSHSHRKANTGFDHDDDEKNMGMQKRSDNENVNCNTFKSKNRKQLDESCALIGENVLGSKTDSNFQNDLSPIKCSSSTVRERCVPTQYVNIKGEGSMVTTSKNMSTVEANRGESRKTPDNKNYDRRKTEKMKMPQSNSADLESSSDASELSSCFTDDNCLLNQKKAPSGHSPASNSQRNSLRQNLVSAKSCRKIHQDVISQGSKNEILLGINSKNRFGPDGELNVSSNTKNPTHIKNKFDIPQKISKRAPTNTGDEKNTSISQKSPVDVMKLNRGEAARSGNVKRKRAVFRMHAQHNKDDAFDGRRSNFERYDVVESESGDSDESTKRSSGSAFEFSPVCGRKTRHSKKHSPNKDTRRNETDIYLYEQEQIRSKRLEQQNVSRNSKTNDSRRCRNADKNLMFTITELQEDENDDDFRISKEDMDGYDLTEEDSDTVYINY